MAHLSVKQRAPLRKSFIPSRRQSRHFASRYRAMARLLHPPPLRRAAPVVRNRRHVADRGDLEAHGLERADGGLAASPGPAHEDLDLLEPVLHRLARGDLGGRLRGERRALARAPEAGAPGARPGDDVAHPVGERDDRVIEGRLDVRDARADLAPLALLAALPPWCRLLLFGHALRSCLLRRGRCGCRGRRFLLHHHAAAGPLPRPRVRVRPLAAHRQTAPVADPAIAPDVHESFHVHRHLAAQVTLDLELALDDVADAAHLVLGPRLDLLAGIHVGSQQHPARRRASDPVDVRDRDLAPLLPRQVNSGHSRHRWSPPGYPWRALCRGFLQITRVTPRRLMILQCSQRTLIDGLTFIVRSRGYLNRYVIRPRVRSYGESSTLTRSPGRIRMKFIRILPLTCASTRWPLSSSTRNIAFGSGSTTVPSTSIASSFGI